MLEKLPRWEAELAAEVLLRRAKDKKRRDEKKRAERKEEAAEARGEGRKATDLKWRIAWRNCRVGRMGNSPSPNLV